MNHKAKKVPPREVILTKCYWIYICLYIYIYIYIYIGIYLSAGHDAHDARGKSLRHLYLHVYLYLIYILGSIYLQDMMRRMLEVRV